MSEENINQEAANEQQNVPHTEEQATTGNQTEPQAETTCPEEKELSVEEKLEAAQKEVDELKDQLLRKIAEFDNYRKRTLKEKTDLILNGGEKMVTAVLPVIDDMERAIGNMKNATDVSSVLEGVELIYKKFLDILSKQGVSVIDTKDADFNTDLHDAVANIPAPTQEAKGKVIDCVKTGYKMNEKVIRHAQVVVGS